MHAELISRSHHIDQDEPDASGIVAWRYEYDLVTMRATSGLEVTARTYTDTPGEASLLRFTLHGQDVGQGDVKRSHMDAVAAFRFLLREEGFDSVTWLGGAGYVGVPHSAL
ncbi:hypothetical protein GCM10023339_40680 [Alloalcanivorax gelatiniphagus]